MCSRSKRILLVWAAVILAAWLGTRLYARRLRDEANAKQAVAARQTPAQDGMKKTTKENRDD